MQTSNRSLESRVQTLEEPADMAAELLVILTLEFIHSLLQTPFLQGGKLQLAIKADDKVPAHLLGAYIPVREDTQYTKE